MNREFFALYLRADGMASWTGPWETIDAAKAAVPDNARSVMIVATPTMPVLERRQP